MTIWKITPNIQELNQLCQNCAVSHLGIEFVRFGENWLEATLQVDQRTTQPFGLLHGGVSAVMAETLGSAASLLCCESNQIPVGKELNIRHLKAVKQGVVTAKAQPINLNTDEHIWEITQYNEKNEPFSIATLVVKIITKA
ncbi:hotdog fold thioesterase [Phocoenobacter skyensis]|uniref:Hotdog fold thioesterase n=1 Tax=Phocoenobacter skyensis TaxID=97481 RepID=A0A1H7VFS0_9PAST|nr:hotdog fold thioesterase [Pasteurella skyensis]MDP8079352.1 hotdog fold thioesterase [Pasteurella skyensis]MDP8085224.1 hotdog fold thioesterase [Pasteurella skyensis]MDP8184283.1 hotdog fold thioesterase [Pasteurella skyensis]QLB23427.1 esterase [Pasteurella skyensis]SEM07930.1 uncharacterized domain 1-containing protein [Pasteurella skyensis]